MKKPVFLFVIFCLTAVINISAQTNTTTLSLTQQGMDLYEARKYKEAIIQFNGAIKENPKDGKAFYYRGLSKMHDGQKGFCKDLEESLTLGYSNSSDIYYYGCETQERRKGKN